MSFTDLQEGVLEEFAERAIVPGQLHFDFRVIAPLRDHHRPGYARDWYRRARAADSPAYRNLLEAARERQASRPKRAPGRPGPSGRRRMVGCQGDTLIFQLAQARAAARGAG